MELKHRGPGKADVSPREEKAKSKVAEKVGPRKAKG